MSKAIGKIIGILLSISIIVTGICMMMQCLSIYNSGDKPFSREAVALAFDKIAVLVYICIALTVISFIYNFFIEGVFSQKLTIKNSDFTIKAISVKKDLPNNEIVAKERRIRKLHTIILTILVLVGFACFFAYSFLPSSFHQSEINASMIKAMIVFCISITIPFIYSIICIFIHERSRKRELNAIREILKDAPAKTINESSAKCNTLIYIKIILTVIGLAILLYGLFSGGTADVLTKAINICTECIGLG